MDAVPAYRLSKTAGDSERERTAWWLSAAALLLLLAFAALGVAVTIVDPNDYKPQIVAALQRATGRTLSLGGALRISRSLWPTIEVTNVMLANLPGGTRPDLVRAERIEAQLSLPALLHRRIEVSKLMWTGMQLGPRRYSNKSLI